MDEVKGKLRPRCFTPPAAMSTVTDPRHAAGGPLLGLLVPGVLGRCRHSTRLIVPR